MFSDDTKKLQQITVFFVLTVCFYGLSSSIARGTIDATTVGCTLAKAREAGIIAQDAVLALIDAVMSFAIEMLQTGKRLHLVNSELAAS